MPRPNSVLAHVMLTFGTLAACSGLAGPDHEGLQKQYVACGANATHFIVPAADTLGPVPQGDPVGYDANPASQNCVLDWAKDNGFKVLSPEDLKKMAQDAGLQ
jgi:hypothetical protein